jgi:glycosyltransferase involved in cell wall biosynthesis
VIASRAGLDGTLLVVGHFGPEHVGARLLEAAGGLGVEARGLEAGRAFAGARWLRILSWRLRGRRPVRLGAFGRELLAACRALRPRWLLATGIAPVAGDILAAVGRLGVRRLNYLTDDPWNPAHRAPWFLRALPAYDHVFTPRRANVDDLVRLGCGRVSYLPFAYAPELHFPEPPATPAERARFDADVVFVGGADDDRVAEMAALVREGFQVALYGGYWERYPATRARARGQADAGTMRKAIGGARVALGLVRRANRDDNAMRTFELAAIGACILAEDTPGHRELFGEDGEAVVYFRSRADMIRRLRELLAREDVRRRLAAAARQRVVGGRHTYGDRLRSMLTCATADAAGLEGSIVPAVRADA